MVVTVVQWTGLATCRPERLDYRDESLA